MKKFIRNIAIVLLVVLVIAGVGGFLAYNQLLQSPLPQHQGEITIEGLQDTVEIIRDEWGVPHIYASTSEDLFFGQGYAHAQDRWWQMEFSRHIASGRIQELTGRSSSLLGSDIFIRTAGWWESAERDMEAIDPDLLADLEAFSAGVNAYLASRSPSELALEYRVLGLTGINIEIEPWEPIDSLAWGKVMSNNLSGNRSSELFLSSMMETFDEEMVEAYFPEWPFDDRPTIIYPEDLPEGTQPFAEAASSGSVFQATAGVRGLSGEFAGNFDPASHFAFTSGQDIGSNNWVVGGSRTASGMPLLANDPHLGIQMPSIWYEVGLHCRTVNEACPYNVVGFTFSANPGVVVGHNDRIAWGVTNVGWDTQDLYRITVNPENELQYEWNGEWRDMEVRDEVIRFGGSEETLTLQVRETHLGPIINDNQLNEDGSLTGFNNEDPLAFRWTTTAEIGSVFESVLRLNRAQNWDEFRDALRYWDSPSQNIVYADVEGNIGYQTPGRVPIRAEGHTGLLPVDGTTDQYEWQGYVPYEYLPSVLNPERDYIATANQALVPKSYYDYLAEALGETYGEDSHYTFSYRWAPGYRGQRIVELLEASEEHTADTFAAIHGDNKWLFAEAALPYLEAVEFEDAELAEMRDWLVEWDAMMNMDSAQGALFAHFWVHLQDRLFDDELAAIDEAGGSMLAVERLLEDPENAWWDDVDTDDTTETRDDILRMAFESAVATTREALGDDREAWEWGALHTATFVSNPLGASGIDLIEGLVNRGPVPTGGGNAIVNATGWNDNSGDFSVRSLPSMRMIVDMADFSRSLSMHTTGQSGHPASPAYNDMIDPWRQIEYHPMLWTREQVEAAASSTLILQPAGE